MDGITVAKSCVAFLVSVLVLALLAVTALAILTNRLDESRKLMGQGAGGARIFPSL
jgi:hypothetical protein